MDVTYIPIMVSIVALLLSFYQFLDKNNREDTTQLTTVIVKLESIGEGVNEIKSDLRSANNAINELRERVTNVENRSKANTQRLNALDGRKDD